MTQLRIGSSLGPYRIEALLGAGGMGQMYKARDTRLDRAVAIKIVQAQFSSRFEREARAKGITHRDLKPGKPHDDQA